MLKAKLDENSAPLVSARAMMKNPETESITNSFSEMVILEQHENGRSQSRNFGDVLLESGRNYVNMPSA